MPIDTLGDDRVEYALVTNQQSNKKKQFEASLDTSAQNECAGNYITL